MLPSVIYNKLIGLKSKPPELNYNFSVDRADRLTAIILSVLTNMDICSRFLNEINMKIADAGLPIMGPAITPLHLSSEENSQINILDTFTPKIYERIHSILLPVPEDFPDIPRKISKNK